jgi:hypothetical protein
MRAGGRLDSQQRVAPAPVERGRDAARDVHDREPLVWDRDYLGLDTVPAMPQPGSGHGRELPVRSTAWRQKLSGDPRLASRCARSIHLARAVAQSDKRRAGTDKDR